MASSTITELAHLQIPLGEIQDATNNFSDKNIIGKGGFGNVYKGKLLRSGKSIKIAARRLNRKSGQGDVEFWTEISMLAGLREEDVVSLVGFCDEGGEKIIITHRYPKGSLLLHIRNPALTWKQRLAISIRIAAAIDRLHNRLEAGYYVIHRNINSSTILLNDEWKPMLSGFEYSIKHLVDRKSHVVLSEAIGTPGYIDPAIQNNGGVSHKSDIYSLGVVLFEILCSRTAKEDNRLLAPLAKYHYENGTLQEIIHPDLWNQIDLKSFRIFSEVAYSCLGEEPTHRPKGEEVVIQLALAEKFQNDAAVSPFFGFPSSLYHIK